MENANPRVFESVSTRPSCPEDEIEDVHDDIDTREIFGKAVVHISSWSLVSRTLT